MLCGESGKESRMDQKRFANCWRRVPRFGPKFQCGVKLRPEQAWSDHSHRLLSSLLSRVPLVTAQGQRASGPLSQSTLQLDLTRFWIRFSRLFSSYCCLTHHSCNITLEAMLHLPLYLILFSQCIHRDDFDLVNRVQNVHSWIRNSPYFLVSLPFLVFITQDSVRTLNGRLDNRKFASVYE